MEGIIAGVPWVRHPFLLLHIISGFVGMYSGLVPLFTRKGGTAHRRWGLVFVWAIGVASITSFPLAFWGDDLFQAAIGLLTGYLAFFGLRSLRRDSLSRPYLEWTFALGASLAFLLLIGAGAVQLTRDPSSEARAAVVFGMMGLFVSARNILALTSRISTLRNRVLDHMLASCLALVCAVASFLNTQLGSLTGLEWPLDWRMLFPVVLGAPMIAFYLLHWSRRLQDVQHMTEVDQPAERSESARLRFFAIVEGVSFLILLCIAMPLKHLGGHPELVKLMGPIHGALFVLYVTAVLLARWALRWPMSKVAVALAAGVIPGGTFVFEARLRREERTVKGVAALAA